MEILCFFAGTVFYYTKSPYALCGLALALVFYKRRQTILCFLVGIVWAYVHQGLVADRNMPETRIIPQALLIGTVSSIPSGSAAKTQFQFSVSQLDGKPVRADVLLSCYLHCPSFKVGQIWQLQAKIKKPASLGNPGSFDYQGRLHAQHIRWTGYVKSGKAILQDDSSKSRTLNRLREQAASRLKVNLPDPLSRGIVGALTLGLSGEIDRSQWDLFRRTGTTHLMVISGAHISLVAGIVFWLLRKLWSCSARLCLFRPAAQAAGVGSLLIVSCYALLTGLAPPAQRALLACLLFMLRHILGRRFSAWQAWRYALLIVVVYEPHTVMLPGFYLSFLAVAILMASSQRLRCQGIIKMLGLQLACLAGLLPLSLYWFSYGALTGLAANLVAVPLVGYVLVPLSLLSLLSAVLCSHPTFLLPVHLLIKALLHFLEWVDQLSWLNISGTLSSLSLVFALMLGVTLLFLLPIKGFIPASLCLIFMAFFPGRSAIQSGAVRIDVLDVGQGLSVVVNTSKHTLIYDTGMKFYQGSDMAQLAVIPYLNHMGIKKIDTVIISHPDLDHRGGLLSLEKKYSIANLLVDKPEFYQRGKNCHQHPPWVWDGVSFRFFPVHTASQNKNNSSCVLQIATNAGKILLPGDIEKPAETELAAAYGTALASDVLIVAHHGSKTSSSPFFLNQVTPKFSIISAGFDNRYHFPHAQTIAALKAVHSTVYNTETCGMTTVYLDQTGIVGEPECYSSRN